MTKYKPLMLALICAFAIFIALLISSIKLQVAYFGTQAYENDAGANFGTLVSSVLLATVVATISGVLLCDRLKRTK